MAKRNNMNGLAPKWYRIAKPVMAWSENLVILLLLATGNTDSSLPMIIYKICSSSARELLDIILVSATEQIVQK